MTSAWRVHRHQIVTRYLISLREEGVAIRAAIEALKQGVPADATATEVATYLWFEADHWIGFVVNENERAIYVTLVEKN